MKFDFPILTMVGFFFVFSPIGSHAASPKNMLPNASFEEGGSMPVRWNTFAYPGTTFQRDATAPHNGSASARINVEPTGAEKFPCFNYTIEVQPEEEYEASVWVKTQGVKSNWGAYMALNYYRDKERVSWTDGGYSGGGDRNWYELKTRVIIPKNINRMMITVGIHAEGTVWFDDIRLVKTGTHAIFSGDSLTMRVRPNHVINSNFIGYGAHGDYFLTLPFNIERGVDDHDRQLVQRRVESMRPGVMLVFFNYQWWEPNEGKQTPDSEAMRDLVSWLRFLQSIGTKVIFQAWGDNAFYSEWMLPNVSSYPEREGHGPTHYLAPKLPLPEKREAMVRSFVDAVEFLRRGQGLTNVEYVSLMCEPDNDDLRSTDPQEYIQLNRLLDGKLRERGMRKEVKILGPEDSGGPLTEVSHWMRETVPQSMGVLDGVTAHTYRHPDTRLLAYWVQNHMGFMKRLRPGQQDRPFIIDEFGHGGDTFTNPYNASYDAGLYFADFGITAVREGTSSVLVWCLFDTYYNDTNKTEWGLWKYDNEGWRVRPGFYSWSLMTRYTRPGSKVVAVTSDPSAESVPTVAFVSPTGELTVMMVNRGDQPIQVSLNPDLDREGVFRRYEYSKETVPTPRETMIEPSAILRSRPGKPIETELPERSFVLLTEVR